MRITRDSINKEEIFLKIRTTKCYQNCSVSRIKVKKIKFKIIKIYSRNSNLWDAIEQPLGQVGADPLEVVVGAVQQDLSYVQ
jgi:hypothetical protein